ncbi:four-carbon acid sugar kinase family protein [Paenibacillus sp. LMG 31456]|uniref:Four-carbon acid sugar kinase family protein n=1 Tax=Paenibacillus foliorum TaxID=2654974 RepID=A0A972GTX8_9BACL|nr:four-carbon acid sugar kinase family protein [Paenibacillus foliorum]NOU96806.1 four-carbon acid sugar kinase family protein [Paenibacillus foliorum]
MRICYYGDDFTGSTDVLEALTVGGLRMILFMDVPDAAMWNEKFSGYDGFGVAGVSRTFGSVEMERELRPKLQAIHQFQASITHYKVCSTFDSSPDTGSIGKVIEIGSELFTEQRYVPVVAGCPLLKRYTVFGNHFTGLGDGTIRLDRHPNMSSHPITPMNEADLRLHLAEQTGLSIGLIDILDLGLDPAELQKRYEEQLDNKSDIVLFDVVTEEHLVKIGRLLTLESERTPMFAVGSSGLEYALVAYWRHMDILPKEPTRQTAEPVDRMLVISGSCSPVTEAQITWAMKHGYEAIRIPVTFLLDEAANELALLCEQAENLLREGRHVILYTALGPQDTSIQEVRQHLKAGEQSTAASGQLIGMQLGELAKRLVLSTGIKRVIFAGGDTSGFALSQLDSYALELVAPIVPGGPLCKMFSRDERLNGLEIVLKGGQVGPPQFFEQVRTGCKELEA